MMNTEKREQLRRTLRSIAENHASMMKLLEQMSSLLGQELTVDPIALLRSRPTLPQSKPSQSDPVADRSRFSVIHRGKSCFLGNSLPFRFFARLAHRPYGYLSYRELLTDVWNGERSDEAIRSVVKTLRNKLREAGMSDLADAIDGSESGHYALKLR